MRLVHTEQPCNRPTKPITFRSLDDGHRCRSVFHHLALTALSLGPVQIASIVQPDRLRAAWGTITLSSTLSHQVPGARHHSQSARVGGAVLWRALDGSSWRQRPWWKWQQRGRRRKRRKTFARPCSSAALWLFQQHLTSPCPEHMPPCRRSRSTCSTDPIFSTEYHQHLPSAASKCSVLLRRLPAAASSCSLFLRRLPTAPPCCSLSPERILPGHPCSVSLRHPRGTRRPRY